MKRLTLAAAAAALMLAIAPQLHAQTAQQGRTKKPDSTASAKRSSTGAAKSSAAKSASGRTAKSSTAGKSTASKKKARRSTRAKADTAVKKGE